MDNLPPSVRCARTAGDVQDSNAENLFGGVICLNELRNWASGWVGRMRSVVKVDAVVQGVYSGPLRLSFGWRREGRICWRIIVALCVMSGLRTKEDADDGSKWSDYHRSAFC